MLLLTVAGLLLVGTVLGQEDCYVDVRPNFVLRTNPYVFKDNELLYPPRITSGHLPSDSDYLLSIPVGQNITLSCGDLTGFLGYTFDHPYLSVTCNANSTFEADDGQIFSYIALRRLSCNDVFALEIEEGDSCWENSIMLNTGYNIGGEFFTRISICFERTKRIPLYTAATIKAGMSWTRWEVVAPFPEDPVYFNFTRSMDEFYEFRRIQDRINTLLGLPTDSEKYLNTTEWVQHRRTSLRSGPVFPPNLFYYEADFVNAFRYINSAPLWTGASNMEFTNTYTIFPFIANTWRDVEVYSGVYGVATLPHEETGEDVELYLEDGGILPIPEVIWKVVYDPSVKQAVVLLTYNNPFVFKEDSLFCKDVSDQLPWFRWPFDPLDIEQGYSLVCGYDEVAAEINYLPHLDVTGLLV